MDDELMRIVKFLIESAPDVKPKKVSDLPDVMDTYEAYQMGESRMLYTVGWLLSEAMARSENEQHTAAYHDEGA